MSVFDIKPFVNISIFERNSYSLTLGCNTAYVNCGVQICFVLYMNV